VRGALAQLVLVLSRVLPAREVEPQLPEVPAALRVALEVEPPLPEMPVVLRVAPEVVKGELVRAYRDRSSSVHLMARCLAHLLSLPMDDR
jgi:hypothetical protein